VSFLIDPPLLYASGRVYAARTPPASSQTSDALLAAATMAVFWGVSVSLYLNRGWTRPMWRLCRASSGRDWMLNSGVLRLDPRRAGAGTHAISAAIFATYPIWLWLGMRDGRRFALRTQAYSA
jgi:hypothetical protein